MCTVIMNPPGDYRKWVLRREHDYGEYISSIDFIGQALQSVGGEPVGLITCQFENRLTGIPGDKNNQ